MTASLLRLAGFAFLATSSCVGPTHAPRAGEARSAAAQVDAANRAGRRVGENSSTATEVAAPATPSEAAPDPRRAKLASDDAATRAWGAWEAGEAGASELVPEIVVALRRALASTGGGERTFELRAEVDALVRLDARLSAEDLAAVSRIAPLASAAIVLAAREPRRHADTLIALRSGPGLDSDYDDRMAIDAVLASGVPQRAVELLLPEVRMQVIVNVSAGDTGRGGGHQSRGIGCGTLSVPAGFPPTVRYRFVAASQQGSVRFTDGPRPIGYVREVHGESTIRISETTRGRDEAQHALDHLRWIAHDEDPASVLTSKVRIRHVWVDAPTYLDEVERVLAAREQAWNALVARLVEAGHLAPSRVPVAAPIEFVVEDDRPVGSVALPERER